MGDLFTVDQLAATWDLHPRTIRRYIREGKLKAVKVGGEWRIPKDDAEDFSGVRVEEMKQEALDDVSAYLDGKITDVDGKFQACTVLDCYVKDSKEALRISEVVMQLMNADDPTRGRARFQYFYVDQEQKGRYIIWGNPTFVGKVLSTVGGIN